MRESVTFGQSLKSLRRGLGLTQGELALRAQCATETIRKLEAGKRRASRSVAQNLADALQLDDPERATFLQLARAELTAEAPMYVDDELPSLSASDPVPLLGTKLYLPKPRNQQVVRQRLLARLEECIKRPLTLIAAPAGFGKTTLLAEWIHQPGRSRHIAWLAQDASDSDAIQFLRYLIRALQSLYPMIGATVLPLLGSAQPPQLQPLLAVLVNELTLVPEESVLVLDDYHVIDAPTVHEALTFLLDHLPPQLHLVIASRANPPLPLARMRARGQLVEIRAADLRFTTDEVATFLQEVMGLPLSATDVAAIEARTEGWIAGLQLAAISLQEVSPERMSQFIDSFTGSHRFVVDYLVDEVLANQPAHIQSFLLATSILDRLCGPLCAAVVGMANSTCQQLLEHLERVNLFIVPLDEDRLWYRYHHLFAQVLQERLLRGTMREEVATLHRHAALWFEQNGNAPEAIKHRLAAQDWEGAAHLIELNGWMLTLQGQSPMVRQWFKLLPEGTLYSRPYLLELQAGLYFGANELVAAEAALQAAEEVIGVSGSNDPDVSGHPILTYATMMRANIARGRGDIARCAELSQQVFAILPPQEVIRRSVAALGMALIFRVTGDVGPANEQRMIDAVNATRRAGNLPTLFNALVAMAEFRCMQGQLREAVATYRRASEVAARLLDLQVLNNSSGYYCGAGTTLVEWNQIDEGEQLVLRGVELTRGGLQTHGDVVNNGFIALARLQQMRGKSEDALATLQELRTLANESNFAAYLQAHAESAVATLALRQGDLASAVRWADSHEWLPENEHDYLHEQEWLTLVRIRILQGRDALSLALLEEVIALLDRLIAHAEGHRRTDSVIRAVMLRALAMQALGNINGAIESLENALRLALPEGYLRLFVDEGSPMARLLIQLARSEHLEASLRNYVEMLVRVLNEEGNHWLVEAATPSPIPTYRLAGGESLTAREVEVLHLLAAGKSNRVIADELIVEVGTVKRHVSNIIDKLQAQSRLEAVVRARELKLIPS